MTSVNLRGSGKSSRLVERGWSVVGFAECMFAQGLEVDGASRLVFLFRADYHAVTPCHRRTGGYFSPLTRRDESPGQGLLSPLLASVWPRGWECDGQPASHPHQA